MKQGIDDGFEMIGAPVKSIDAHFINGRFYRRLVPLVGSSRNLPDPPSIVLKIATRLHPGFRKRNKKAARAISGRIWLDELRRWEQEWKPQLVATSRRLGAVDPLGLDDAELAEHLLAVNRHLVAGVVLHFRLHISDLGPIGLLLVRGRDWGVAPAELMQCLSGYSDATSAPAHALRDLRRLLASMPASLEGVRASSPDAAAALDEFLVEYGDRLTGGYDLSDLTLREMSDTVLAGIRAAGDSPIDDSARQLGDRTAAAVRDRLPPDERVGFDELLADARKLYGLRDENGPITYQWPAGVMRRIVLHAAERLVAASRLTLAAHVFDLSAAEIAGLLRGGVEPTVADIERRFVARREWATLDAPRVLGPEPTLPSLDVLPGPLAQLMDVVLTVLDLIESPTVRSALTGVGIGNDVYVGRARVMSDAIDALSDFEPGDILVTPFTVPTINSILAMAGAVVTEQGGLLSHAAVIAREFGIPGVIGVPGATSMIPDGARIEVNAGTGSVTIA